MTSKPPHVPILDTTLPPSPSDSTPSLSAASVASRRLFNRLRLSVQSLTSIQTDLPEYTETGSIRSFQTGFIRWATTHPAPSDPDRDSIFSSSPSRHNSATSLNEYEFKIRAHKPWVTLKVHTLSLTTPGHKPRRPHFTCNDSVSGVVELHLDSPKVVQRIAVSVIGRPVTSAFAEGISNFLEHSVVVWAKEDGDPRDAAESGESTKVWDGKLQGSYEIPFSFPFPAPETHAMTSGPTGVVPFDKELDSTSVPQSGKRRNPTTARFLSQTDIPFPPSFREHGIKMSIEYGLELRVVQGRFKPDSMINAPFKYFLATTASSMSERRRAAYKAKSPIPGPLADPDGWMKLPPARIMGQMILSANVPPKPVSMDCTLYLATPLTYVCGSIISCYLTLQSEDETALHALSSPNSPHIRLIRRVTSVCTQKGFDTMPAIHSSLPVGGHGAGTYPSPFVDDRLPESMKECAVATWWVPPKDAPQERTVRRLEGEIHLPRDLYPTCPSNILKIEYFVEVLPPIALEFEPFSGISSQAPSDSKSGIVSQPDPKMDVLVYQPVDIVMWPAKGDRVPTPFARPRPEGHRRQQIASESGLVSPFPREK